MSLNQVAYTGCGDGSKFNIRVWDIQSAAVVGSYTGGVSHPRTLCFVEKDYILSAQRDKPAFSLWSFRQYDQLNKKFAAPGKVRCLDVSPCGSFAVAGVDSGLYIWEVSTGTLLGVVEFHYQPVSNVKFTTDGLRFVSASMDSTINVWNTGIVGNFTVSEPVKPDFTFKDHSQPITDLAVRGSMIVAGSTSGLLTIHDMRSNTLEFLKNFGTRICSVCVDNAISAVFVGLENGKIMRVSLEDPDSMEEFSGHEAAVRCLSISKDDSLLLSGSDDSTARIWDARYGHLFHLLRHDGPVTNARIADLPANALKKGVDKTKALRPIANFQRTVTPLDKIIVGDLATEDLDEVNVKTLSIGGGVAGPVKKGDNEDLIERQVKMATANMQLVDYMSKKLLEL